MLGDTGRRPQRRSRRTRRRSNVGHFGFSYGLILTTSRAAVTRWIKGEFIGKGTRGKVFLALNANTGEMVAVKQIQLPTSTSDMLDGRRVMFADAIKSQSTTLRDLDHPNVVQCLGFDETEDYFNLCALGSRCILY